MTDPFVGDPVVVGEGSASLADLEAVARANATVSLASAAVSRIERARAVVTRALASGEAVYGLTTGLGERVSERLPEDVLQRYSIDTLRARANSVGAPLPVDIVRGTMFVRLTGLAAGYAGASLEAASALRDWLNAGLHPRIPGSGSIGASDLCVMAHLGLALMGEGQVVTADGWQPVGDALAAHGMSALTPSPKDGLALCGASSVAVATAGLATRDIYKLYARALDACALSMEAFEANLSPLLPDVAAAHAVPRQQMASEKLYGRFAGSVLLDRNNARRVQDPLSFRCAGVNFGALEAALDFMHPVLAAEISLSGDNPAVLVDSEVMLSTGNFQTPLLTLGSELLTKAVAQQAASAVSRAAALLTGRLSDLPHILRTEHGGSSGFAPLMKVADALLAELRHLSQPVSYEARWTADGVEDELTNSHLSAQNLREAVIRWRLLVALEMMVATEAMERRNRDAQLPESSRALMKAVRSEVDPLGADRPLGVEMERLAATLAEA